MDNLRLRNNVACKKYRDNNKEKRRAACASWNNRNPEKTLGYSRKHEALYPNRQKEKDPAKLKQYRKAARINFRNKPGGKLNHAISFAVWRSLKSGAKAGRHWENLMGYVLSQLMHHLEKQFTPEMSWSNYGSYWHVDHKIPITFFSFKKAEDIGFRECWKLENLQPLEKITNIKKGNALSFLL
jgi:5-methylcytosine-specific restriction endonuclease McrA